MRRFVPPSRAASRRPCPSSGARVHAPVSVATHTHRSTLHPILLFLRLRIPPLPQSPTPTILARAPSGVGIIGHNPVTGKPMEVRPTPAPSGSYPAVRVMGAHVIKRWGWGWGGGERSVRARACVRALAAPCADASAGMATESAHVRRRLSECGATHTPLPSALHP